MTHRGGNGFDSGESPSRDAAVRGFDSRPLHSCGLFTRTTSCEAGAVAIPPRLRGHDGTIIMEVWNDYRSDYHRNRFRHAVLSGNRHLAGVAMMNEIPENAALVSMSNNDDHLAVFAVTGVYTEIVVYECWLDDDGKPVTSNYYSNNAHLYLTPDEARALAEALLQVTAEAEGTEPEPSGTDALIQRALDDAIYALEDVRLIDMTVQEAVAARNEIESILAAFAERARRIAHQEARDAE